MSVLIIISVTIFIAVITGVSLGNKKDLNFRYRWLNFLFIFLLIPSVWLIIDQETQIREGFQRRSWPIVKAVIVDTKVVGERAYNPELTYRFQIDSMTYINKSNLHTPGFGRKRSRKQTSKIIISDYQIGNHLNVYYNPDNPLESYIRTGPYWTDYMQLSTGILILYIAVSWITARLTSHYKITR